MVFNDNDSYVEKFIFLDDKQLLVSVNGKSSYSKWEYIKANSSLVLDDDNSKYLFKIVVCNKDIIVLNIDSTDNYSFLINAKSSKLKNVTYEDIQWYLIRSCNIDILTDKQRRQLEEEKKIEAQREEQEEKQREKEQLARMKKAFVISGVILLCFLTYASIKSYVEYKKYHPTIYTTKDNNKDAIDLGLSVKWASCNVGANAPEEFGNYYGWGDTTGLNVTKGTDRSEITDYQFPPRKSYESLPISITNGKFDMAKANWGNKWRLPSKEEVEELMAKCTISKVEEINGNYCFKITGPSGNHIYLPLADLRYYDGKIISRGKPWACATIWTGDISDIRKYSDSHNQLAYALVISQSTINDVWSEDNKIRYDIDAIDRCYGLPVRAVLNE